MVVLGIVCYTCMCIKSFIRVVQEEARTFVPKSSDDLRTLAFHNEVPCHGEGTPRSNHHDLVKDVSIDIEADKRRKDVPRQTG